MYGPCYEEQRKQLPVWVVPGQLAHVRDFSRSKGEELAGGLVRPGGGIGEGDVGEAIFQAVAVGGGLCWENGGIEVIEDEGVETLQWDIHGGGARAARKGRIFRARDNETAISVGVAAVADVVTMEMIVVGYRRKGGCREREMSKGRGGEEEGRRR
jgi:hypothetical protein